MADDREEEFYYTEIEVSYDLPSSPASFGGTSSIGLGMAFSPTLSHQDMARPPSEGTYLIIHYQILILLLIEQVELHFHCQGLIREKMQLANSLIVH